MKGTNFEIKNPEFLKLFWVHFDFLQLLFRVMEFYRLAVEQNQLQNPLNYLG